MRADARSRCRHDRASKFTEPRRRPPTSAPSQPAAARPAVGDRVVLGGLGLEGVVTAVHDGTRSSTSAASGCAPAFATCAWSGGPQPPSPASVQGQRRASAARRHASSDLNVIGCTVDEALSQAGALSRRVAADRSARGPVHPWLRHRPVAARARGFLQQHPLVARFDAAPPDQGGGGVTVVELKD